MALFRMAFFRLFALVFRHFAWRISFFSSFRLALFRLFVISLGVFRYFVFSLGVISSWRRAISQGEKTKERNNEMAQTSHHTDLSTLDVHSFCWCYHDLYIDFDMYISFISTLILNIYACLCGAIG